MRTRIYELDSIDHLIGCNRPWPILDTLDRKRGRVWRCPECEAFSTVPERQR